jgi:glycosyltransferase involved in cell wall biosynthesis
MRILVIASTFLPRVGGAEFIADNLIRGLHANGHQVVVIGPSISKVLLGHYPVEVRPLPRGVFFLLRKNFNLGSWFLKIILKWKTSGEQYDIIQWVMGYPFCGAVDNAWKLAGIPQVLQTCGADVQKDFRLSYGYRLDPKKEFEISEEYSKYESVIVYTESIIKDLDQIGIDPDQQKVIAPGIDLSRFEKTYLNRAHLRLDRAYAETIILITVGRNHPKKGFAIIPKIAERLVLCGIDFKWVIIGRGFESLIREAEFLKVDKYFIFAGEIGPDSEFLAPGTLLIEELVAADIFVFPTLKETFGLVIVEAMASGLPVVTSRVEGPVDIIDDGVEGFLLEAGNIEKFVEKIVMLANNKSLKQSLSSAAIKKASKYDWRKIISQYENLYISLLEKTKISLKN